MPWRELVVYQLPGDSSNMTNCAEEAKKVFDKTVEALVPLLPASASVSSSTPASSWPVRSIKGLCRSGEDQRSSCSLWRLDVSVPDSLRGSWFCLSWTVVAFMPHKEKFFTFAVSLEGPGDTKSFLWKLPADAFTKKVLVSPHHRYSRRALGRECWAGAIDLPRRFPFFTGVTRQQTSRLGKIFTALASGMHEASSQLPLPPENYWMPSDVLRDMKANVAAPDTFSELCNELSMWRSGLRTTPPWAMQGSAFRQLDSNSTDDEWARAEWHALVASTARVLHEERGDGDSVACGVILGLPPDLEQLVQGFKKENADLQDALDIDVLQEANRKHYVLTDERESSCGVWLRALRMDCLPKFPEATSAGGTVDGDADQADTVSSDDEDEQLDATVKHRLIHVDLKVGSVGQREAMSTISVVLLAGKFDQAAGQLLLEAPVFVRGAQSIAETVTVRMGCWVGHNVHIFELVTARLFEPGRTSMPENLQKWFRTGLKEGSGTVGLVHGSAGVSKTTGYALNLFADCVQQGKRILALTRNTVARNQLLDACALPDNLLERCVVIGHSMLSARAKQRTIESIQAREKEPRREVLEESIAGLQQVLDEVEGSLAEHRSKNARLAVAQPRLVSSMEEKVRKAHDLFISCRESND